MHLGREPVPGLPAADQPAANGLQAFRSAGRARLVQAAFSAFSSN
jgi:hypothetical protein